MDSILKIENLSKQYGKITALDGLNLEIEKGMVFGILGPNGSGKTTTLGIVLGILRQNLGDFIWFDGKYGLDYRRKIGALLETPNFYAYLNAIQNLKIVAHIKQSKNDNFDEILKIVNLEHRKFSKFSTYSLGMKQRLAIASAMVGDPEVYIFDEPTNGLDPQGIAEIREIILRIASTGKTIFMASHILDEVEKVCSNVAIIKNGKLLAQGSVGSILNDKKHLQIGFSNLALIQNELKLISGASDVRLEYDMVTCILEDSTTPSDINKYFADKGIYLNHLAVKKQRLEEEFLLITSNKN